MNNDVEDKKSYIIRCENLVKIYKTSEIEVVALQGLDLNVEQGELMAIIGNSGSGKSTLLNMIGGLDKPSAGALIVDGKDLFKMSEKEMNQYKRNTVGFVWQNSARNLIPYLTARENIKLVKRIGRAGSESDNSEQLLELVGLGHRKNNKLGELSGGEQQRVAIAIALANEPKLLLADEPTGAVDTKTSEQILDFFRKINRELGITVVIVTHDRQIARKVDRVVAIRDGKTSSEFVRKRSYVDVLQEVGNLMDSTEEEETHEELAVLDKAGRVQIPREYLDSIEIKNSNKVKIELEGSRIVLYKPER
ncbi:MAG: ABC transporter ATP-binding protein [Bacillota bacterium]|nr:ABC transporter ATP-binding protein [Bacillota bacterium]